MSPRVCRFMLFAALVAVSGCAGLRERPLFTLELDTSLEAQHLTFPPLRDGQVPRYVYVGELRGEPNIRRPDSPAGNLAARVLNLFDLVAGEAPPLVLDRPQAGAVDGRGRIYVTDIGRGAVFVFDETVPEVRMWTKADDATNFISPAGIATLPDGQILVTDADLGVVARLDENGNALGTFGSGLLERPNGIAYDPGSRRIFVADTSAHHIKTFNLKGELLGELGERGDGPREFNFPTHVSVWNDKLYVTDTMNARVQVISTLSDRYLGTVGKRGIFVGDLSRPKGVAADSEDNIYVVESYFDYLLVYNRRGEFLMPLGGTGPGPGQFHLPSGVWIDARNRVYVADMLNSRVAVFQFLGGDEEND